jgi:pSer/pThr/pTyr-binding forkhead associated (FHA) protein
MPKLHFTGGGFDGTVYDLTLEKTSVGRSHTNTVIICDRFVSAKQCDILVNGSEVIVRDLGSRNGTIVNGRRLQNQQCGVKSGHIIAFGLVQARLEIELDADETDLSTKSAVYSHSRALRDERRVQRKGAGPDPSLRLQPANFRAGIEPKTDVDATLPQFAPAPVFQDARSRTKSISWKTILLVTVVVGALILFLLVVAFS